MPYRFVVCFLVVLVCAAAAFGGAPQNELGLSVTIVIGEHSRDSNSTAITLTVSSTTLTYEQTYQGARSERHKPVKKEYRLTKHDLEELSWLLKEKHLLVTATLSNPPHQKGYSRYFELSISSRLNGKESTISIEAFPGATDIKTDRLYQGSVSLIQELYKFINRTDPDITAPSLIN